MAEKAEDLSLLHLKGDMIESLDLTIVDFD